MQSTAARARQLFISDRRHNPQLQAGAPVAATSAVRQPRQSLLCAAATYLAACTATAARRAAERALRLARCGGAAAGHAHKYSPAGSDSRGLLRIDLRLHAGGWRASVAAASSLALANASPSNRFHCDGRRPQYQLPACLCNSSAPLAAGHRSKAVW